MQATIKYDRKTGKADVALKTETFEAKLTIQVAENALQPHLQPNVVEHHILALCVPELGRVLSSELSQYAADVLQQRVVLGENSNLANIYPIKPG